MRFKQFVSIGTLLGALWGCEGSGSNNGDGGSGDCPFLILDAYGQCDPTASFADDLFIFEAETDESVESVEVDVYVGGSRTGTVRLQERGSGNWYGEEWADDLDSDCDDWSSMYFEIFAEGGGCEETATINP